MYMDIYLEQRYVIVVRHLRIIVGMGHHSLDVDLFAVVRMRLASRNAQLDRPVVEVAQSVTSQNII